MEESLDTVIVGAGVIGAAVAYALKRQNRDVIVLEARERPGMGMSSRNSGVVHAGLYYPADSLKTRFCRRGRQLLLDFATNHGVAFQQTGKYLVANSEAEMRYLAWLQQNARDVPLYETEAVPDGIQSQKTLFSPNSGIVDVHGFLEALTSASEATYLFGQEVEQIEVTPDAVTLQVNGEWVRAALVINCAGLGAARFAGESVWYAQGAYAQVSVPQDLNLPHLIYPAVPKGSPSLGIHFTRNIHGEAYLGPDVEWIDREQYGVDESRMDRFLRAARSYLPWLTLDYLQPGYAGIRPKRAPEGFRDFAFKLEGRPPRVVHCLGIESPGLTAALAIGEYVAGLVST